MARKPTSKKATPDEADELALEAIRSGAKTGGAVASKASLGVTAAYQAVERLKECGGVVQSVTGELSVK